MHLVNVAGIRAKALTWTDRAGGRFVADRGKLVLAYSGGLDTSVAIHWLKERGWDVVALSVDLGEKKDLDAIQARALTIGAAAAYVGDRRAPFLQHFVWPALRARASVPARGASAPRSLGRPGRVGPAAAVGRGAVWARGASAPLRHSPDSQPPASGLAGIPPVPWHRAVGRTSFSISRTSSE